jgi:threonine synthase
LDGFSRAGKIPVVVLFPEKGVSEIQKIQMCSQRAKAHVIGVEGADFDFCQNLVKKILNQPNLTNHAKVFFF